MKLAPDDNVAVALKPLSAGEGIFLDGGTLMFVDLNGLAQVNLQHGMAVGDEVLRVVADRLREACPRRDDLVGRLGGDEFALFFAGLVSPEVALRKAQQVVESICRPVPTSVGPVHTSVSIGVQVSSSSHRSPKTSAVMSVFTMPGDIANTRTPPA